MRQLGGWPAVLATALLSACARDRATELPDPPIPSYPEGTFPPNVATPQPFTNPARGPDPSVAAIAPRPASASSGAASSGPKAPPPPPAALSSPPPDATDLFHAQDACLSSCDQFACMKIAAAYRQGLGLPRDVLAGRRYAIHACLECGKPGPGIADQCPDYQLSENPSKPRDSK
jgi:hypothetical protein